MNFYKLTDAVRNGDVVRAEGRKHYVYSFGPCRWVRTTLMLAYMTPSSPLYGKYEEINGEQAKELVLEKSKNLIIQLKKAQDMCENCNKAKLDDLGNNKLEHVQKVSSFLDDIEQKITYLLSCTNAHEYTSDKLLNEGFSPRIVRAVEILRLDLENNYAENIKKVRVEPLARAARMAELDYRMDTRLYSGDHDIIKNVIDSMQQEYDFLDGKIEADELLSSEKTVFVSSMQIFSGIGRKIWEGRKIPHGISNPVIRYEASKPYLAFFSYSYKREEIKQNLIPAPAVWVLCDIKTGDIVKKFAMSENNYSSEDLGKLYSMNKSEDPNYTQSDFINIYARLDRVRADIMKAKDFSKEEYNAYFESMLKAVPDAYHVFYRTLSSI